jgi:ComF family protein
VLGTLLARHRAALATPLPELLVPVPLHDARLRHRGYNQADELARYMSRALGLPRAPLLLERTRATSAQSLASGAERRQRVRGVFRCTRPLQGERLALIDDVLTTGSTAQAAAEALLAAGAGPIELWVVGDAR